jgi:hypothetical protein
MRRFQDSEIFDCETDGPKDLAVANPLEPLPPTRASTTAWLRWFRRLNSRRDPAYHLGFDIDGIEQE